MNVFTTLGCHSIIDSAIFPFRLRRCWPSQLGSRFHLNLTVISKKGSYTFFAGVGHHRWMMHHPGTSPQRCFGAFVESSNICETRKEKIRLGVGSRMLRLPLFRKGIGYVGCLTVATYCWLTTGHRSAGMGTRKCKECWNSTYVK